MPRAQYDLLSAGDDDKSQEEWSKRLRQDRFKRILFHVLILVTVMFAGFQGMRVLVKSYAQWLRMRPGCHNLPIYHTLPSGHKIPSVALGNAVLSHIGSSGS